MALLNTTSKRSQFVFLALMAQLLGCATGVTAKAQCPVDGETELDCPWAETTRAIGSNDNFDQIRSIINQKIPGFLKQVEKDAQAPELLSLWSLSRNIDESRLAAGTLTVQPNILKFLNSILKVPYNDSYTVGHAGLTHTYGYLFSNMSTPFGFKRFRYVAGEIEAGFGLENNLFSGRADQGTLLSNLTAFAAPIAFRDSETAKNDLLAMTANQKVDLVPQITYYPRSKLEVTRVVERVENEKFVLEMRTDFVPFVKKNTRGKNQVLLIYSIDFHKTNEVSRPRLVTIFPVEPKFMADATDPSQLRDRIPLKLKYNAMLPVSIPADQMIGRRYVE